MSDITSFNDNSGSQAAGTKINRFLANTGVIIIKEMKEIGTMKCNCGAKLTSGTMILATAKSSTKVSQKTFGIKLEATDSKGKEDSSLLDFDESEEFINAISFIHEASQRIATEKRDYTEATFCTKDQIQFGFYQTVEQDQLAFIRLGSRGALIFFTIKDLPIFKKLIEASRAHLIKMGAGGEEPQAF